MARHRVTATESLKAPADVVDRVLADSETWFLVEPAGAGCSVTIGTDFHGRGGMIGKVERWLPNRILPPIYAEELAASTGTLRISAAVESNGF